MPHGWKLCLQAFHPSSLTCGCYGFLPLLGLAFLGGQAVHSTKSREAQLCQHWPFGHGPNPISSPDNTEP